MKSNKFPQSRTKLHIYTICLYMQNLQVFQEIVSGMHEFIGWYRWIADSERYTWRVYLLVVTRRRQNSYTQFASTVIIERNLMDTSIGLIYTW